MYRNIGLLACLITAAGNSSSMAAGLDDRLGPLAPAVGYEWRVEGNWSNGSPLKARAVYEPGLDGKIIKSQVFVSMGETEYQRYESIIAWHPEKQALYELTVSVDGEITEWKIEDRGQKTLQLTHFETAPGKPNVRQTMKFTDEQTMDWIVEIEQDGAWRELLHAPWRRREAKPSR